MRFDQPRRLLQSMSWLHTWSGLLAGWLLFAVFVTGSLAFFRDEITVWMQPEVQSARDDGLGLERALAYLRENAPDQAQWMIGLPNPHHPEYRLGWGEGRRGGGGHGRAPQTMFDGASGEVIQPRQTAGGRFLADFHYHLYGINPRVAEWIVGIAAMFMFAAIISGIVVHRNFFKDFFSFRPGKGKRSWLDAHNLCGVLALPFHLVITFSGLILLGSQLMPSVSMSAFGGDPRAMMRELHRHKPAGARGGGSAEAASLADINAMLAIAREQWHGIPAQGISISNPGKANAVVEIQSSAGARLSGRGMPDRIQFEGVSGRRLPDTQRETSLVSDIDLSMQAVHIGVFATPLARSLLFLAGLLGAGVIATGLVMWLLKRKRAFAEATSLPLRLRLVEVLNVAAISGLLVALAAYFWGNRLIPVGIAERNLAEIHVFFIVWVVALLHAVWRPHVQAWVEQLSVAGVAFLTLPVLNAISGGSPFWKNLSVAGQAAGFDLVALCVGGCLLYAAWRVLVHVPAGTPAVPELALATPETPKGT